MIRTVAGSKQSICQYLWHYVVTIPGRYIFFWKIDKNTTIILDADGFELRGGFHQRLKCRRYLCLILVAVSVRSFDEVAVLFVCDKICEQKIPEYSGWSKWSGNQSLFGKIVYRMCFFFLLLFDWLFNFASIQPPFRRFLFFVFGYKNSVCAVFVRPDWPESVKWRHRTGRMMHIAFSRKWLFNFGEGKFECLRIGQESACAFHLGWKKKFYTNQLFLYFFNETMFQFYSLCPSFWFRSSIPVHIRSVVVHWLTRSVSLW